MLSRVANSLYWMSRNIERTESNARVLRNQLIQILEASAEETLAQHDWDMVLEICTSFEELENIKENNKLEERYIINYLACSKENQNSFMNCIHIARENAKISRDHLPDDLWGIWNDFYLSVEGLRKGSLSKRDIHDYLNRIKLATLTAQGAIESSMSRGIAYRFIKIGKWLERAEKTARILNVVCNHSNEDGEEVHRNNYYNWRAALQALNGYEAYLKSHPPTMDPKLILSFLITDESFPRSIRYCINHVRESISEIEGGKISHYSKEIFAALDELGEEFNEMKIKELNLDELSDFLDYFQNRCNDIGKIFSETYYLIEPMESKE
ncbi:alpha-E domain-containing protein [Evansella tamaricis]|uniref:Alpha-E domain-containing protein n=1 Tax=Evansella tamaricis TaxID=2069301 RepID=A0ABS6JII3_9BACI|nr:alpha-E domain-containing protein [Evansella tamaricis]MBU9712148.1 alpha-E domain-containing protein [Evansella tamaricis]